jgi:hypothetical protein
MAVVFLPRLLLDWDLAGGEPADRARAVNEIRAGLLQALDGLVVIGGALLTWRQLQVSRTGQVTDAYADLHFAHLDRAHLFGVDLEGADLTGGRLDHAMLTQANPGNVILADVDLTGAVVDDDTRWPTGSTPQGTTCTDLRR